MRLLRAHDRRFEVLERRGKGSHRMIYHPDVNRKPASMPLTWHKGRDIRQGLLLALIRRFALPRDLFG